MAVPGCWIQCLCEVAVCTGSNDPKSNGVSQASKTIVNRGFISDVSGRGSMEFISHVGSVRYLEMRFSMCCVRGVRPIDFMLVAAAIHDYPCYL